VTLSAVTIDQPLRSLDGFTPKLLTKQFTRLPLQIETIGHVVLHNYLGFDKHRYCFRFTIVHAGCQVSRVLGAGPTDKGLQVIGATVQIALR